MKTGLVLEGGGMRGMYTVGVLDRFLKEGITFDYVIGVSAGACNGISYVAGQRGRNYRINTQYATDRRYISLQNLVRDGSLFGMDFLFQTVPDELVPFDSDAFFVSPTEFFTGVTDVWLGRPVYLGKEALDHDTTVLRASSSIPCFSPMVPFRGGLYLDGGTSDPIPFRQALADGCDRVVVVLTRDRSYRKTPEQLRAVYRAMYRHYPALVELLDRRHMIYNRTLDDLREAEANGSALVIAPRQPLTIDRFERRPQRLSAAAQLGYHDAAGIAGEIRSWARVSL